jgi:isopentenyl diphosphate isomerase/L-lactate dehydrogenase-like FMN-dependent dehydrogenase
VLVLEPRGGLDVVSALALGARAVTAVEVNPLVVAAAVLATA